jgi:RNA polymerase sigma-70 factor (ECF subfamily)
MLTENSDQLLVRQYLAGNHSSLQELIEKYQGRVYGYLLMLVKDRHLADDLFQDTFLKAINKIREGSYNEEGKFLQWIMRIAHNLAIDHFRRNTRVPMVYSTEEYDIFDTIKIYDNTIEEYMITEQIHQDIRKLIEHLPTEQREVLMMRHYAKMSFKEIAEQTEVSINTALGRMRYALINMRKLIEEHQIALG